MTYLSYEPPKRQNKTKTSLSSLWSLFMISKRLLAIFSFCNQFCQSSLRRTNIGLHHLDARLFIKSSFLQINWLFLTILLCHRNSDENKYTDAFPPSLRICNILADTVNKFLVPVIEAQNVLNKGCLGFD